MGSKKRDEMFEIREALLSDNNCLPVINSHCFLSFIKVIVFISLGFESQWVNGNQYFIAKQNNPSAKVDGSLLFCLCFSQNSFNPETWVGGLHNVV